MIEWTKPILNSFNGAYEKMKKIVSCRSCGNDVEIKPLIFQSREYANNINCFQCWSASKAKSAVKTSTVNTSSSFDTSSTVPDIYTKYEVGDSVFINTDKYGVLLCQILDVESYGTADSTWYSLDVKGKKVDFVDEDEMFISKLEATSSNKFLKL